MSHAWLGAFQSTVEAAKAYAAAFPDKKISVLVDYYGTELDDAVACYQALGDRLASVRIDTHGGRFCQGVTNTEAEGDFAAIQRMRSDFGVDFSGRYGSYAYGKGVTVEATYCLRQALDKAGAKNVGITVSSGFTPEKVQAFVDLGAPIAAIGSGSFLPTDIRDTYATMDIVAYDGVPKIKVGREWLLQFQRKG
jgi:nicotinate phosphoribosyltransferase